MAVESHRANAVSGMNRYSPSTATSVESRKWLDLERLAATAIIICSTLLCCFWALRVPIFQEPDEVAHADAAFAYFAVGHPFVVPRATVAGTVMSETHFLIDAVGYRKLRYDKHAVVPRGYGSRAYFRDLDRQAPLFTSGSPPAGSALPYALALYPSPYYFLVGMAMRIGWLAFGHSLSAAFFAGRFVNVSMLTTTLALAYILLIELRFSRPQRLMLLTAVAFFPMSIWMGAYMQPDNQSALFLVATLLSAVALRKRPRSRWLLIAYIAAASALGLTKIQYAIVANVATIIAFRNAFNCEAPVMRLRIVGLAIVIPTISIILGRYLSPFGYLGTPPSGMVYAHSGFLETVRFAAFTFFRGITDALLGGDTFKSFWFHFGVRGGHAFSESSLGIAECVVVFATLLAFAAWIIRQNNLFRRLQRIASHYGRPRAWQFVGTDATLNMYVLLSVFLFGIYAFTGGYLPLQGRYWYPILIPIVILSVRTIGGAAPRKYAHMATTVACAFWLCYTAFAAPSASMAMERDFYDHPYVLPKYEIGEVESDTINGTESTDLSNIRVRAGSILSIRGSALDTSVGLPAFDVRYNVDGGRELRAKTHIQDRRLWIVFNDERLRDGGFAFDIDTRHLAPGAHKLYISAYEKRALDGLPIQSLTFFVEP